MAGMRSSTKNVGDIKNYLTKCGCEQKKKNTKGYINGKGVIVAYMGVVFVNEKLNITKEKVTFADHIALITNK